jgi:hypothetical protein
MQNIVYKRFTENDIQKFVLPQKNTTITITSATDAYNNNCDVFSIGSLTGTVNRPDFYGATTSNITASGAMNHIARFFYNRYIDTYYDSTKNIYTIPRADTSASSCFLARLFQVSNPTKDQGIYPDTFSCTVWFNGTSAQAIDTTLDSLGVNKESLNYGYLVDASNTGMKVGTIFYDYGLVLFHGGTGDPWSYTHTYQTDALSADINYKISFDSTKYADSEVVITDVQFNTMKIIARNIYYCRANHNEFNYTSNPSAQGVDFLQRDEQSRTYITTIGLYNDARELLAVAKVNPPKKKSKYDEVIFQVTLDF